MPATQQLLDRYKEFHRLTSDYSAAKKLGVTRATVSKWRNGGTMDAASVAQIAHDLGIDFDAALAEVSLERPVSTRDRAIWERMRARVSVAILAAIATGLGWQHDVSAQRTVADTTTYTLCALLMRRARASLRETMLSVIRALNDCALAPVMPRTA